MATVIRLITRESAISPIRAKPSTHALHCVTCWALRKLRCGSCQQPRMVIHCSISSPRSLAYISVSMRADFPLRHASILPSCFHSFHNNSICHRQRITTNASCALSFSTGTLVSRITQSANCNRLLLVRFVFLRLFPDFLAFLPPLGPQVCIPL